MPLRALAVTTRHHPVAIGVYTGLTVLAALYLADVATAASLTDETNATWAIVWQTSLLLGGVAALCGALAPTRWLLPGLAVEALGAMTLGVELGIYAAVMATTLNAVPWASVTVFSAVAVGCLCRSYTALRDRRRIIRSVLSPHAAIALAEVDE